MLVPEDKSTINYDSMFKLTVVSAIDGSQRKASRRPSKESIRPSDSSERRLTDYGGFTDPKMTNEAEKLDFYWHIVTHDPELIEL